MTPKILQQGAEAIISLENNHIIKNRIKKSYRLHELDNKLRKSRTKSEGKIINKLYGIIPVPKIININDSEMVIEMEYIKGEKLSQHPEDLDWKTICKQIGKTVSKLHEQNIIHGDLTTSNMILKDNQVYLIDFGLAFHSHKIEDKAVDLHLLKQAFEAKHFKIAEQAIKIILENYNNPEVLKRLKVVENRGRYKEKI